MAYLEKFAVCECRRCKAEMLISQAKGQIEISFFHGRAPCFVLLECHFCDALFVMPENCSRLCGDEMFFKKCFLNSEVRLCRHSLKR